MIDRHYSPRELSSISGIPETTLAAWRCRSRKEPHSPAHGPRFIRLGRCVRYPAAAVEAWLGQRELVATPATK